MAKEVTDYTQLIPPPPADIVEEIIRQGAFSDRDIVIYKHGYVKNPITEQSESMAKCTCTACGEKWYEEWAPNYGIYACNKHIKQGAVWNCPNCGAKVKLVHSSEITKYSPYNQACWITVFNKMDEKLIAAEYIVVRRFDKNGEKSYEVKKYAAVVFESDKKSVQLQGYTKFFNSLKFYGEWWQKKKNTAIDDSTEYIYPYQPNFTRGTVVENSRLEEYLSIPGEKYPINYLRLWQKRHNVETLIDIGLASLINKELSNALLRGYSRNTTISNLMPKFKWKEKSPYKITGCDRNEIKLVRKYDLSYRDIDNFKSLKDVPFTEENLLIIKNRDFSEAIQLNSKGYPTIKTLKYLDKQKAKARYYIDYMEMAEKLQFDLSNPSIRYPKNLTNMHNRAVSMIRWQTNEKLRAAFEQLTRNFEDFKFEKDGICIRIAESENELICEGKILEHCVGGYGKEHCSGKSIFFVRKAAQPDEPWYTLQIDIKTGKQLQLHGYKNDIDKPIPEEVKKFTAFWEKEIFKPFDVKTMTFIKQTAATA